MGGAGASASLNELVLPPSKGPLQLHKVGRGSCRLAVLALTTRSLLA